MIVIYLELVGSCLGEDVGEEVIIERSIRSQEIISIMFQLEIDIYEYDNLFVIKGIWLWNRERMIFLIGGFW